MSATMTAQLVTDALLMAIWRRGKPYVLLHHSDQGSQYTSEQFKQLMADNGVTCSMNRSGNVWANAAMESFFSTLKTERTARKVHRSRNQALAVCSDISLFESDDLIAFYAVMERLRDSVLFAKPYFELVQIVPAIEEGFQHYEQSAP
jgi:transposase InsO family protein